VDRQIGRSGRAQGPLEWRGLPPGQRLLALGRGPTGLDSVGGRRDHGGEGQKLFFDLPRHTAEMFRRGLGPKRHCSLGQRADKTCEIWTSRAPGDAWTLQSRVP